MKIKKLHFPFVSTSELRKEFQLGKSVEFQLRQKLPSKIYWVQIPEGRKILWNLRLVVSYLMDGVDAQNHKKLVEKFLDSLEQTA